MHPEGTCVVGTDDIGSAGHDEGWRLAGPNVRWPPALERQGKACLRRLRRLVGKKNDA